MSGRRNTLQLRRASGTKKTGSLPPPPTPGATPPPPVAVLPPVASSSTDAVMADFGEEDNETNLVLSNPNAARPEVKSGNLTKLIERLTYEKYPDPKYLRAFLLTYRSFTDSETVLKLLKDRYLWVPTGSPSDRAAYERTKQRPIRLRVYNVLKAWIQNHFSDFEGNEPLKNSLLDFVQNVMPQTGMENPSKNLLKEFNRASGTGSRIGASSSASGSSFSGGQAPKTHLPRGTVRKLLDIHPEEVARQLTLIEHELFKKIQPSEFLGQAWSKKKHLAPNILAMINWSNRVIKWVATTIVTVSDYKERVATLKHVVEIAERCRSLNNFNGVMEIVSGLNSSAVHRLRKTWQAMGNRNQKLYDELSSLVSRDRNFHNFREYLKTKISPPSIPYLGVYLTDLTFIDDGNNDNTSTGLINFEKRKQVAKVIEDLQSYQREPYVLNDVPFIQEFLKTARVLTEEDQYTHSHAREKKVGRGTTVLVETNEEDTPISSQEDFGELEKIDGYPFYDKDSPKNLRLEKGNMIVGGTLPKLVERVTYEVAADAETLTTFLMTYRTFVDSTELISLLRHRFFMPKPVHCTPELMKEFVRKKVTPIHVRTVNVLKHWVDKYWDDFLVEPNLAEQVLSFVEECYQEPLVKRICEGVKGSIERNLQERSTITTEFPLLFENASPDPQGTMPEAFLAVKAKDIAIHLTYLTRQHYSEMRSYHFLAKAWENDQSGPVFAVRGLNDDIRLWLLTELLCAKSDASQTTEVVGHVVAIANECFALKNFSTCYIIHKLLEKLESKIRPALDSIPSALSKVHTSIKANWIRKGDAFFKMWSTVHPPAIPPFELVGERLEQINKLPDMLENTQMINFVKRKKFTKLVRSTLRYVKTPYPDTDAHIVASVEQYLAHVVFIDEQQTESLASALPMPARTKTRGMSATDFLLGDSQSSDSGDSAHVRTQLQEVLGDASFRKQLKLSLQESLREEILAVAQQDMILMGARCGTVSANQLDQCKQSIIRRKYPDATIVQWKHTDSASTVQPFSSELVLYHVQCTNAANVQQNLVVDVFPHLTSDELAAFLRTANVFKQNDPTTAQEALLVCIASTMDENIEQAAAKANVQVYATSSDTTPGLVPLAHPKLIGGASTASSSSLSSLSSLSSSSSTPVSMNAAQANSPIPTRSPLVSRASPGSPNPLSQSSPVGGAMRSPVIGMRGRGLRGRGLRGRGRGFRGRGAMSPKQPQRFQSSAHLPRQVPAQRSANRRASMIIGTPPKLSPTVARKSTAPAVPAPSGKMTDWDTASVVQWIKSIGFPQYASNFEENLITGEDLLELTSDELQEELEITDGVACHKISAAIQKLADQ